MVLLYRLLPIFVLSAGLTATFFTHSFLERESGLESRARFVEASQIRINAVKQLLHDVDGSLLAIKAFFDASQSVSKEEFKSFTLPLLKNNQSILTLSWSEIKPNDKSNNNNPSSPSVHDIIFFDAALQGGNTEFNDWLSSNFYRIQEAMTDGENRLVFHLKERGGADEMVVVLPTVTKTMRSGNTISVKGFAMMKINLASLMSQALASIPPAGIHLDLKNKNELVGRHISRHEKKHGSRIQSNDERLIYQEPLEFSGNEWTIVSRGINSVFYPKHSLKNHTALYVGALISCLIAIISYVMINRHIYILNMVKEKTSELNKAHLKVTKYSKNLEQELNKRAQELIYQQRALDQHAIVSIANVKGDITYVNDKFIEISQFSENELLGKNHRVIKSDFHPNSFYKEMWHTIANGDVWTGEIKNQAKDGTHYWMEATIVPFLNDQGKPEKYISIRTDITHIKTIEEALLVSKENAERANKVKSEFVSAMSHELRTPLNSILGFSQLLESDTQTPLTEDQKESVGYIINGGQHLLDLVNQVLDLSTIEDGSLDLSITEVPIRNAVNDVLSLMHVISKKANVKTHVSSELDLSVQADPIKLKQILLNLVGNAIKYNKEGGSVSVNWCVAANMVKVSVVDTGIGIPKEFHFKLFTAFNRLGQENSTIAGTGVGLLVTKSLVELMGGMIGFESVEGKGSTFWFELPIETKPYR